ncbi:MAG: hypothetical protein KKA81_01340 [Bacteroidetes bacterium]|nr:hypothetical protein [Bacteroidota bacterium]
MHISAASQKTIILVILIMAVPFILAETVYSQGRNEEVTIIAPYKPTISDASKINVNPEIQTEESRMPEMQYSILPVRAETFITPEPVDATHKPLERYKNLKRNFLRAGFGNYTTPYFEFFANSRQSEEHALGVHLKHISSSGTIKDYANSAYSRNKAVVFGRKYFDNHVLGGEFSYDRDVYHWYGYKPAEFDSIDLSKDDIKHRFQNIGFNAYFRSTKTDEDAFNHFTTIKYNYLTDNWNTSEQNILFTAGISKRFEWFDVTEYQTAGLDLKVDYYLNDDSVSSYTGGLIKVRPYLSTDFRQYRFYVGADLTFRTDSAADFYFHPIIKVEADLIEDALTLYAGIDGSIQRVSYKDLSQENPYVLPIIPLGYMNEKFRISGGIRGNISEKLNFNIMADNTTVNDLPLFVNDTANKLGNTFTVIYDNANIFRLRGEINMNTTEALRLNLYADFRGYTMKNEEKAWHRPGLQAGAQVYYTIRKKFLTGAGVVFTGPMYAKTINNKNEVEKEQINDWADLSLSFEYRITDSFSAFVNLNNVLNNGYMKWYNYPVQKFNLLAGLGYTF